MKDILSYDPNWVWRNMPDGFLRKEIFKPPPDPSPHMHGSCEFDPDKIARLSSDRHEELNAALDYYSSIPPTITIRKGRKQPA
jgi:hypothetical protein